MTMKSKSIEQIYRDLREGTQTEPMLTEGLSPAQTKAAKKAIVRIEDALEYAQVGLRKDYNEIGDRAVRAIEEGPIAGEDLITAEVVKYFKKQASKLKGNDRLAIDSLIKGLGGK